MSKPTDREIRAKLLRSGAVFPTLAREANHNASRNLAIEARRRELKRHEK